MEDQFVAIGRQKIGLAFSFAWIFVSHHALPVMISLWLRLVSGMPV